MRISLALIVTPTNEESEKLDRLLQSVKGVFDEICVTQAGPHPNELVSAVIKKHQGKESFYTWKNDFASARNFSFEQCTGDWIMWLDADDILKGGKNIKQNVELAEANGVTGLSTLYHYSHDEKGNVTDSHWKLQLVKNGYYEWKGVIHEDLLPRVDGRDAKIKDVIRVHTATRDDAARSLARNKDILEAAVEKEPEEPRHYFYLARCYLGTEEWKKVIDVVKTYLTLSNWPEERYDARNMMGEAYMRLEDHQKALQAHSDAILELEDAPDAYIYKARNYIKLEQWLNALTNLEIAETRDQDRVILKKAALYDHDLYVMSAICFMNLGWYDKALQAATRAYQNRQSEQSKEIYELAREMQADEVLTKHYLAVLKAHVNDEAAIYRLLQDIPEQIKDDPRILAYQRTQPPKKWGKNSVVWFCGDSTDSWDGDTLNNGGIGGSETAVIKLSEELVKQGKEVTVYNKCDAPVGGKTINGVRYVNFWEMNHLDHFHTLILWRWPQYADIFDTVENLILDMHDVSNPIFFTPERIEKIDKIMLKTKYHRSLYPAVPDDKIMIVGNGIDLSRFTKKEKNPKKFIYTSCPSRGLEHVLKMWPVIKQKIKGAELHVFYGFKNFYEAYKMNPAKMEWMQDMEEKLKQPGITFHGRQSQDVIAEHMAESTAWLYPTEFPEIHCITALEMQAAGVYPITTGYAALEETQQSGVKLSGNPGDKSFQERFINEVQMAVDNPDMQEKEIAEGKKWAEANSWKNVSEKWLKVV